jgi:ankyrin repeat protein
MAVAYEHLAVIWQLAGYGARLRSLDNYDRTPINHAASHGQVKAIQELVTLGANMNAINNHGETAFHDAARNITLPGLTDVLREATLRELVECGINLEAKKKKGETALQVATESAAAVLLSLGAPNTCWWAAS